jgi:hypothetical protein
MGHKNEKRGTPLVPTAITQAMTHIQFPIQWVLLALPPGLNRPKRETDLSNAYSPKDTNTSAPTQVFGRCLMKDKGNFILT